MEQYKVGNTIYFKKDMTTGYIKSCLVREEYLVKKEDNTEIIVLEKDITRDIDFVIKTLKLKPINASPPSHLIFDSSNRTSIQLFSIV